MPGLQHKSGVRCKREVRGRARTGSSVLWMRSGAFLPDSGETAKFIVPIPEQSHPSAARRRVKR